MVEEYSGVKFKTLFEGARFGYPNERKAIIDELAWLKERNLIHGIPGNISLRVADGVVITPTGKDLSEISEEDIVLVRGVNERSKIVKMIGKHIPSSESMMHWLIYGNFPDVGAIVHFHDNKLLKSSKIVETEEAHPYGTLELAHIALKALKKSRFILLKEHGALVIEKNMKACNAIIEKALKTSK